MKNAVQIMFVYLFKKTLEYSKMDLINICLTIVPQLIFYVFLFIYCKLNYLSLEVSKQTKIRLYDNLNLHFQ